MAFTIFTILALASLKYCVLYQFCLERKDVKMEIFMLNLINLRRSETRI